MPCSASLCCAVLCSAVLFCTIGSLRGTQSEGGS